MKIISLGSGVNLMDSDEYELFIASDLAEVTDDSLWKFTPRMLVEMSQYWGCPLDERGKEIRAKLLLAGLDRADIIHALIAMGCQ